MRLMVTMKLCLCGFWTKLLGVDSCIRVWFVLECRHLRVLNAWFDCTLICESLLHMCVFIYIVFLI